MNETTRLTEPIFVQCFNHFDPIWRRCWDRRLTFDGQQFVSYAELEDYIFSDNIEIARRHPDYKFRVFRRMCG